MIGQRVSVPGMTPASAQGTVVAWLAIEEDVKDIVGMSNFVMRRVARVVAVVECDDGRFRQFDPADLLRLLDA